VDLTYLNKKKNDSMAHSRVQAGYDPGIQEQVSIDRDILMIRIIGHRTPQ
jgi:hypothetical protein